MQVDAAWQKVLEGRVEDLTVGEVRALRQRWRADREMWHAWARILPQVDILQASGLSRKVLREWQDKEGLPFREVKGKRKKDRELMYDLREVLEWFRRRARGAKKGALVEDEDDLLVEQEDETDPSKKALTEYRQEQTRMARLKREQLEGTLIDRHEARGWHARLAEMLRGVMEGIVRIGGDECRKLLEEGLDAFERELEGWKSGQDMS